MYRFDYWAYHIHSELNRQSQHIRAVLSDQDAATLFAAKHYKLHNVNLGTIIPYSELPLSEKVEAIETVSSRLSDALATYDDQMCGSSIATSKPPSRNSLLRSLPHIRTR